MVRLLFVNTVRPGYDGLTMFTLKLLRAMDLSGMAAGYVFIAEPPEPIRKELEALGIRVYILPRNGNPPRYVLALARLIRREKYGIVHAHGNSATLAVEMVAALLGGAKVRIAHSHNTATTFPGLNLLLNPLFQLLTTARMACGREAGRWLFGNRPFEVVPVASDPRDYRIDAACRSKMRKEMGIGDEEILIGCVAILAPAKNHLFLLDAFSRARRENPRLRLALIGDGELRGEIESAAAALGGAVTLTGGVSDVPARMQALDALVLPSLHEGFPNVLVEAQMAGLPALVSENVTRDCDLTGLLTFLPLDGDLWAKAMAALAPIDRESASAHGCAMAAEKGFDARREAAKLRKRYEELIS